MSTPKPQSWLVRSTVVTTLGLLAATVAMAAEVDTSEWKCESCPTEKGLSGAVDAGVGVVSSASQRYGDYTGLDRKGGTLLLGGNARWRDGAGQYADVTASDLGTDARSLAADAGKEGQYVVRLGYDEIPRRLAGGAVTPFQGVGGSVLTLPAGYPAATTGAMPLASTLQPVDIGYNRSRLDLGAAWLGQPDWTFRASARHMTRDGTQPMGASGFATTVQLVVPLHQTTDELELSGAYATRSLQAALAYRLSSFRNGDASLTWTNPFTSGTVGATTSQLALAPDNQFHQLQGSLGYALGEHTRLSADVAVGRMTQNAAFLPPTVNTTLVVGPLPAASLDGKADTLDAAVRLSSSPVPGLQLNASLSRDERNNHTPALSYPSVSTDMFVGPAYSNRPYSFTQDKAKLGAEVRGPGGLKLGVGLDYDEIQRTLQEVASTHETTEYIRLAGPLGKDMSVSVKYAHAERNGSSYTPVAGLDPSENPLLRNYNMANRLRDTFSVRTDISLGESLSLGLDLSASGDQYPDTAIGLTASHSSAFGGDLAWTLSENTRLQFFGRTDWVKSHQVGSQQGGTPDWNADNRDAADVFGLGVRHAAIKDKLDLGADLSVTRSRSTQVVDNGVPAPGFPTITSAMNSAKFFGTYKLSEKLSVTGSYWYEHYRSADWHQDGVLPGTIPNALLLGVQPPRYYVSVVRVSLRYLF